MHPFTVDIIRKAYQAGGKTSTKLKETAVPLDKSPCRNLPQHHQGTITGLAMYVLWLLVDHTA